MDITSWERRLRCFILSQGGEQCGPSLRRQTDISGLRSEDHRHHPLGQDRPAGDRGDQRGDGEGDRYPQESLRTGEHQ